ncbi:hypothetical protein EJ08DRAFT_595433 [Tothia fuscella]|uniref:Zn(2)-C6 fungal-type domain-containing protein n=1 Tax=Tothia fuscella TaxID=1048955 RepID=A0A9P4NJZ8_9PEZI|nr:hypothetical protein EJ08DRAFT_595433 [Tothia fuscella]
MVYCGKPSQACQSCRKRRIKCDQLRPGCTQCSNISLHCPGYRNQLDLLFRDETETVVQKAKIKHISVTSTVTKSVTVSTKSKRDSKRSSGGRFPLKAFLSLKVEDVAINHFLSLYVRGSHFDYLPEVYKEHQSCVPFSTCVSATALATLARELKEPAVMKTAREQYSKALIATNEALADPVQTILDSTLMSVLLLSLFETVAQEHRGSPHNWTAHTLGAGTLLKLRGLRQFETPLGHQLFAQVTSNIRVNSAQRQVPVPLDIRQLQAEAKPFLSASDQRSKISLIVDTFATLRAQAAQPIGSDPATIIKMAVQVEHSVCEMMANLPQSDVYRTVATDESTPCAYGSFSYVDLDHRATQRWNSLRMMSLFLNEMMYKQIEIALQSSPGRFCKSTLNAWLLLQEQCATYGRQRAEGICASIAQFTKVDPTAAIVSSLLWPLTAAGESDLVSSDVRRFVISALLYLGEKSRLPQAFWAAQMLEESKTLEDWYVLKVRLNLILIH